MKITRRQLSILISEALEENENTCWDGYRPGAQTGVKTKKGKGGKRVANCEKISEAEKTLKEAMPAGGVPDMVGYLNKGRPDPIVDAMLDDYEDFVEREGHVTRASSSVAASFFMQSPELKDDHDAHQALADAIGLDHDEIMRDMERQKKEQGIQEGSKMKITKRQLRRIIKEERAKLLNEAGYRHPKTGEDMFLMLNDIVDKLLDMGMDTMKLARELRGLEDDVEDSAPQPGERR